MLWRRGFLSNPQILVVHYFAGPIRMFFSPRYTWILSSYGMFFFHHPLLFEKTFKKNCLQTITYKSTKETATTTTRLPPSTPSLPPPCPVTRCPRFHLGIDSPHPFSNHFTQLSSKSSSSKQFRIQKLMWVFPKIGGKHPKSWILIGFSIINHPFWGFSPYFWKHPCALAWWIFFGLIGFRIFF